MSERQNIIGTMGERESLEAFVEGAKQAASAARELAKEYRDIEWADTAEMLDAMRESGQKLAHMKAMTSFEQAMAMNMKTGLIGN